MAHSAASSSFTKATTTTATSKSSSKIRSSGTRQRLSVEKRFAIIALLEQGVPRREVMLKYNLKHSSNVTTILKRKDSIVRAMSRDTSARAKAIRSSKFPMIDKHLRDFVHDHNSRGTRVTSAMLQSMAMRLAHQYGVQHKFKNSKTYMDKFLMHQQIRPVVPAAYVTLPKSQMSCPKQELGENPSVAPSSTSSDLQSKLLLQLQFFTREHVQKVTDQVNKVMKQSIYMTDQEVVQMIEFKNDLLDHLHDFSSSTMITLMDMQNMRHHADRMIDLAENLMFRLITLSHSLLIRFIRLSRDIQMQGTSACKSAASPPITRLEKGHEMKKRIKEEERPDTGRDELKASR